MSKKNKEQEIKEPAIVIQPAKPLQLFFGLWETLGDIIVSTALIHNLKLKYPNSEITYAVGKQYVEVLMDNPEITEIIACESRETVLLCSSLKEYDRIFMPLMLHQNHTLWHQTLPWISEAENHNLIDYYASRCNDDLEIKDRRTFLYPREEMWNQLVEQIPADYKEYFLNTPFITIHTTSRNQSKDWSYDNFVGLTNKIYQKYGKKFAIYQIGTNDQPLPDPVGKILNLPLSCTFALIQRSKFHIDIDSGPSFIANSLNIPTVCLMGATCKNTSGPIGKNVTFIEPNRQCLSQGLYTPCHTQCRINRPCINTLTVDEVFSVVESKLDGIFPE